MSYKWYITYYVLKLAFFLIMRFICADICSPIYSICSPIIERHEFPHQSGPPNHCYNVWTYTKAHLADVFGCQVRSSKIPERKIGSLGWLDHRLPLNLPLLSSSSVLQLKPLARDGEVTGSKQPGCAQRQPSGASSWASYVLLVPLSDMDHADSGVSPGVGGRVAFLCATHSSLVAWDFSSLLCFWISSVPFGTSIQTAVFRLFP